MVKKNSEIDIHIAHFTSFKTQCKGQFASKIHEFLACCVFHLHIMMDTPLNWEWLTMYMIVQQVQKHINQSKFVSTVEGSEEICTNVWKAKVLHSVIILCV